MTQPDTATVNRNTRLFLAYRIISRCYFHLPVLLFYFWTIEIGINYAIALLAVYGLTSTFSSGINIWLLNYATQKQVVAIGEFTKASGLFLLLWGSQQSEVSLGVLFFSQVVGGAGFAVAMSADGGLLREVVAGDHSRFIEMQTTSQSWIFIATLVAGSIGSVIFDYNPQWPFIASAIVSAVSAFCVLSMHVSTTNERSKPNTRDEDGKGFSVQTSQRFWMLFYSFSRAFTLAPFIGFIPFYFIMVNVDPLLFGTVLSCFTLSAWGAIKVSHRLIHYYGLKTLLFATGAMMVGALFCFGISGWLALKGIDYFISGLVALVFLGFGSGTIRPVTMANLDLSGSSGKDRMLIFSIMERDFGIINSALLLIGAWLLVEKGIGMMMIIFSLLYIVCVIIIGLWAIIASKN